MKLLGTANWIDECICCGQMNARMFYVEEKIGGHTWNAVLCADCVSEEQEVEHYEQQQREQLKGCEPFATPYAEWLARR